MKLRIKGDSIRIRLTQSETAALGQGELISDRTHFPLGNSLCYQLTTGDSHKVVFEEETILIMLPHAEVVEWVASSSLSYEHNFPLAEESSLFVLVEKDLDCKSDRPRKEDTDTFPNPSTQKC